MFIISLRLQKSLSVAEMGGGLRYPMEGKQLHEQGGYQL